MNRSMVWPMIVKLPRVFWKRVLLWMLFWNVLPVGLLYFLVGTIAADKLTKPMRVFTASYTPALFNLAYQDVRFPASDGQAEIAGWYIPSAEEKEVVIMVHGRNASRTELFMGHGIDLAHALNEAGFSVLMIDMRGHGQSSEGRFTYGQVERYDVIGAVNWLVARGYQPGKIGVMGISMGAAAVIGAAAEDERIGAVVSDSGYADVSTLIKERWTEETGMAAIFFHSTRLMIWLKYGYDIGASKPAADILMVAPRPVLLIHCCGDRIIPYKNFIELQATAPYSQAWSIPSCIHGQSYNVDPAAYEKHLISFMIGSLR